MLENQTKIYIKYIIKKGSLSSDHAILFTDYKHMKDLFCKSFLFCEPSAFYSHLCQFCSIFFSVFSSVALAAYTIMFLKLESYRQVNKWCREANVRHSKKRHKLTRLQSLGSDTGEVKTDALFSFTKYVCT